MNTMHNTSINAIAELVLNQYWVKRNKSNRYSIGLVKLVSERTNQIAETPFMYRLTDFN